jgi:hypothetical protein
MADQVSSDVKLEIGHVLFIDIVGYSKLLITDQSERLQKIKEIVWGTERRQTIAATDRRWWGAGVSQQSRSAGALRDGDQ